MSSTTTTTTPTVEKKITKKVAVKFAKKAKAPPTPTAEESDSSSEEDEDMAEFLAFKAQKKAKKEAEEQKKIDAVENLAKRTAWLAENGYATLLAEIATAEAKAKALLAECPFKTTHSRVVGGSEKNQKKSNAYTCDEGQKKNYYCLKSNGKDKAIGGLRTAGCRQIFRSTATRNKHSAVCKHKHAVEMEGKIN